MGVIAYHDLLKIDSGGVDMLQKGQIRFINEAVQVVEKIFQVNKVKSF